MKIDRPELERMKLAYEKAVTEHKDVIVFEGREFFVPYLKYLIEYLDTRLPK